MGRRRSRKSRFLRVDSKPIRAKADNLRAALGFGDQFCPDCYRVSQSPKTTPPHITFRTFELNEFKRRDVIAWANAKSRTIEFRIDRLVRLRSGDPWARWEFAHDIGHVELGHPGNNLYAAKRRYSKQDLRNEAEADVFAYNFLAPLHLARKLKSVEEYVRRFQIPYEKARERKRQVDLAVASEAQVLNNTPPQRDFGDGPQAKMGTSTRDVGAPNPSTINADLTEAAQFEFHFSSGTGQHIRPKRQIRRDVGREKEKPGLDSSLFALRPVVPAVDDERAIERLFVDVNERVACIWRRVRWSVRIFTLCASSLPLIADMATATARPISLVFSCAIGGTLVFFQIWDRQIGLESRVEAWARRKLTQEAEKRGLADRLDPSQVAFKDGFLYRS